MGALKEQYITDDHGKKLAVIVPIKQYEKILEELEGLEDIRLYDQAKKEDDGNYIPLDDYLQKRNSR